MRTVDEILEQANRLSETERRELLTRLEDAIAGGAVEKGRPVSGGPYSHSLAASGTGHTDFPDVSSDKYRHLADAYADERDEE